MKKTVITILILAAAVSLAGCGSQSEETAEAVAEEEAEAVAEEEAEAVDEEEEAEAAAEEEEAEAAAEEEAAEAEYTAEADSEDIETGDEDDWSWLFGDVEEDPYITVDWDLELIKDLDGVIGGVEDMELVAGEGTRADIREPLWYDEDIVRVVMIETGDVSIVTPGTYETEYDICFNREPLLEWMEENGIDSSLYPGMDSDAGRLFVTTTTTVTVTE